jgi:ElaB/YqjD/DUF883 family membrane-anchored ribosome-binding protein
MEYPEVQQQMTELKEDLSKLRSDMGEIMRTMMDVTRSEAGDAKERLEAKAREQIDQMSEAMAATRERGRIMYRRFGEQIEQNPVSSVVTALGIGFMLGVLMNRK